MKNNIKVSILIIFIFILFIVSFFIMFKKNKIEEDKLFNFDINQITKINIDKNEESTMLNKKNGEWFINNKYLVRQDLINNFLSKINNIKIISKIQDNNLQKYELNIKLKLNDSQEEIEIGKPGIIEHSNYIKFKNKIYLINQPLKNILSKEEKDWRENNILDIDKNDIESIYLNNNLIDKENLNIFFINAKDFIDKFNFDIRYEIKIILKNSIVELYISNKIDNNYYLKFKNSDQVYLVDEFYINEIIK